jgi:hypothetical protein
MTRSLIERILIAAATVSGAIVSVWWTNSILPLIAIAAVVYLGLMQQRTDNGEALRQSEGQAGAQRRTRRRDDE